MEIGMGKSQSWSGSDDDIRHPGYVDDNDINYKNNN
jgi:hypothetical protein